MNDITVAHRRRECKERLQGTRLECGAASGMEHGAAETYYWLAELVEAGAGTMPLNPEPEG